MTKSKANRKKKLQKQVNDRLHIQQELLKRQLQQKRQERGESQKNVKQD